MNIYMTTVIRFLLLQVSLSARLLGKLTLFITFITLPAIAEECSAIFPGGAQTYSNDGEIDFDFNAQLLNNPTNSLFTNNLTVDNNSSALSCGGSHCLAGNETVPNIPNPNYGNSNVDVNVGQDATSSITAGYYNDITLNFRSTLFLDEGDYYIRGDLFLANESQIVLPSNGNVRIFVREDVTLSFRSGINANGQASQLLLHMRRAGNLANESTITGYIFSRTTINLNFQSEVNGAITARDINLTNSAVINFVDENPDFGDSCSGERVIPISCAANDVPDIAFSDEFSTVNPGWSAVDFDRSVSNWPNDVITQFDNENQFVVFDINSGSLKINGGLTSGGDNEYGMVSYQLSDEGIDKALTTNYAFSADITATKQGTNNDAGLIFGYENDSNYYLARWTKFGTTYSSGTFAGVYRRFELVEVSNGIATALDFIDDVELDFSYNLEVVVNDLGTAVCVNDEALLYSESTQPELNDIGLLTYDNDIGLTIDNVELRCDDCQEITPLADFHFDSCEYTGLAGDVIDETGNYSGMSVGGLNTLDEGQVARAADFISAGEYVQASIPVPNNFTVSTWFKKPNTVSGNRYFVLAGTDDGSELLYLDRDANYRWGVNAGAAIGTFEFGSLDNNWHHITLVYSNGETSLYIDGAFEETISSAPTGALSYIGTSGNDISSAAPKGFRAPLDEFMVFDRRLSITEITQVYDNQFANKNFDGTTRAEVACATILAEYRFEERSWNGNNGEVEDQTGNYDAVARNGAYNANINSAIVGNPGTCRYGSFAGDDDYVELPASFNNLQDSFTVTAWIKPTNTDAGSRIFADDENNSRGYALSLGDPGNGRLRFYSRGISPISVDSPAVINTDVWTFVTAVHDADMKTRQIYVNGQAVILTGGVEAPTYTGNWGIDSGPATIGGETDSGETSNRFTGDIDEVRIYSGALSKAKINEIYQETHPCDDFIDHFEIIHDGNGITCDAEDITIKACANSTCSILDSTATDVVLSINGTPNRTVTVIGELNTDFSYTTPDTAALSLDYAYQCENGASSSCDVEFEETGFIITDIPTQLSGKPSNIGYNTKTLSLQAVTTDNQTGACVGVFPDGGDIPVNLSYTCETGTCTNNLILTNNGSAKGLTTTAVSHDLRFNSESKAEFSLQYPDAGQLRLNAQKTIEVENDDGEFETLVFDSSSNAFVERPFAFAFDLVNGNALADDADGSVFKIAGEDFSIKLTAVQWSSGQDTVGLGIPSKSEFIAINGGSNLPALNFTSESVTLDDELVLPVLISDGGEGTAGVLSPAILTFDNSNTSEVSRTDFSYSEVGIIDIFANLSSGNYLGSGDNIAGAIYNVGRFYPAYFTQTIEEDNKGSLIANHSDLNAGCEMLTWAYSGQQTNGKGSIVYGEQPKLTITAYNSANVAVKNYIGDFAKLITDFGVGSIEFGDVSTTHMNLLPLTGDVVTVGDTPVTVDDTLIEYTLSNEHHFTYTRDNDSKVAPFDASFEIPIIAIKDSDGVNLRPSSGGTDYFENPTFSIDDTNTVNIRFGRWVMENAYGPETHSLPMKHSIEQYNGSDWIVNDDEACLTPSITAKKSGELDSGNLILYDYRLIDVDNLNYPISTTDTDASLSGSFIAGLLDTFEFSAPNKSGPLQIEYQVPEWFQYDWLDEDNMQDGPHEANPRAIATFGLFRGNDRIIYWYEK